MTFLKGFAFGLAFGAGSLVAQHAWVAFRNYLSRRALRQFLAGMFRPDATGECQCDICAASRAVTRAAEAKTARPS